MGIFDKIKGEFIDIIEWIDDSNNTLVHRFERYDNEIKNGAKLVVREGQAALFVREGQLADVFSPGTHTLETSNLPILSTLAGWKHGFHSPFKAEVYFVSLRKFTDQKWGTKNPIMLRDPEFGPIRLRAFGSYEFRVTEPKAFIQDIVGTDGNFTTEEITSQLKNIVVSRFPDALGESKIPALDLAANYDELGVIVKDRISPEFEKYGLELSLLLVENISLPEEVEKALDTRSSMGVIGNMQQFQQYQTGKAIVDAAQNEGMGGMAAGGMAMGLGLGVANQMGGTIASAPSGNSAPPPLPSETMFHAAIDGKQSGPHTLSNIKQYISANQITRDTLIWKEGMPAWTKAGEVSEVAGLFASVPPPLPM